MSTTVTYKGATLTTVDNATKTLQTAGTWMEGDLTLTDVTQGGGGSGFALLDIITVPADTRAVNLDVTPYNGYDFWFIVGDATLTDTDWLYVVKNGTSPEGGWYTSSARINHLGLFACKTLIFGAGTKYGVMNSTSGLGFNDTVTTNLYIYTYTASRLIKAGSVFYIIGGNYADL